jgi:hypothetical protein
MERISEISIKNLQNTDDNQLCKFLRTKFGINKMQKRNWKLFKSSVNEQNYVFFIYIYNIYNITYTKQGFSIYMCFYFTFF